MMPVGVTYFLVLLCCLTSILSTSSPVDIDDAFSEDEIRDIESFLGDVMGCANIPGLTLGVVRGRATFSKGMGANMATGHLIDKRTIFNLGSTSKAFVPYILAEIMNGKENRDGRIRWNSTLKEILSRGHNVDIPAPWSEISLKDMLTYKSGSSAADLATMAALPQDVSREDVMRRLRFLPKYPEFLTSNHYSNVMYTVAGHLAERISGLNWTDLVRSKVFNKLSMSSSTFAAEGMTHEDAARPYGFQSSKLGEQFPEQNTTLFNLHPFEPVGSIMTSAEDMTKWMQHLLHNLRFKANDSGINMLISDAFHQGVTVPPSHRDGVLTPDSEVAIGYGMGWYASTYREYRRYKYSGQLYAFNSQVWLFPDKMSAVFVAINGPGKEPVHRALDGIFYHISDTLLRKPTWVNHEIACCCHNVDYEDENLKNHKTDVAPDEKKVIKYLVPVEKYIGKFGNGFVGNLVIGQNEAGILVLKIGQNLEGELIPDTIESKLKFNATGSLANIEEWSHEKTLQFLLTVDASDERKLFNEVRFYMKENLFYEFKRGALFETMLDLVGEEKRKDDGNRNSHYQSGDNGHVNDGTNNNENGINLEPIHQSDIKSDANNFKSSLKTDSEPEGKDRTNYNMNGQGDEPDRTNTEVSSKDPEIRDKSHNKQASTSNSKSASPGVASQSTVIFLMIILCIVFTFYENKFLFAVFKF